MTARPLRTRLAPDVVSEDFRAFWTERHLGTLVTLRTDGSPHVVPVGVTIDLEKGVARVICRGGSQKARNVAAAGAGGARVAVSQADGRRWSTLEGVAVIRDDPESVRDAERRYAARFRVPRVNPERVVIEIRVDRVLGLV
ncbi:TIGR03618 family F420-dependent PPOX class oxidoreductase [Pseudonocardia sp. RS010]|uniref:TIGR03618 family F420-dependent PPOX class oxidoreductase n=1 Tax=Pseudonocardia sp. RS010 TaxID=3385979 RepID=UPI0039A15299